MSPLHLCVLLLGCIAYTKANALSKKVLLISMDGFRWDYLNTISNLPNLQKMITNGVRLQYVNNTFITTTFPTHYSMATGLWEESHGIVGNKMYDPDFNESFSYGPNIEKWWGEGEPIWITATKQNLRTATYFWPGSEVELQGLRPLFWKPYDKTVPFDQRVDTVVGWFKNENIHLATLYFYEPDSTGHRYGPHSDEVKQKVREMDAILGSLITKLDDAGVLNNLNIILTSDHGMTEVNDTERLIVLSDYVNNVDIDRIPASGAVSQILPVKGREEAVYQALVNAHPNMTVYKKEDIPEHYHYKNNARIMPIIAVASEGWLIYNDTSRTGYLRGQHGFDNRLLDMRPIFLAQGPNFKVNYKSQSINSVDIYPMICELLDITPAPHNGSLTNVAELLRISISTSGSEIKGISLLMLVVTLFAHLCGSNF